MEPLPKYKIERLEYFLKGDKQALLFCLDLLYVAHLWDDLFDGDKERSKEEVNQGFIKSLAGIPNNPFYQQYAPALLPMMYNALVLWLESNDLANGDKRQRACSFALENAVVEIIHFCVLLKGAVEWAREVSSEFWNLFGPTEEEVDELTGGSDEPV